MNVIILPSHGFVSVLPFFMLLEIGLNKFETVVNGETVRFSY